MAQYRAKPLLVDAIKCKDALNAVKWEQGLTVEGPVPTMPQWLRDAMDKGMVHFIPGQAHITTPDNEPRALYAAHEQDWIVYDDGLIYPCPDDVFQKTYEAV